MKKIIVGMIVLIAIAIGISLSLLNEKKPKTQENNQTKKSIITKMATQVKRSLGIKEPKPEPKEIFGFKVPPKPDPKLNDATPLGIDVNNNMVRDDVERYILFDDKYYITPELKAVGFQEARRAQYIIDIDNHPEIKMYNLLDMVGALSALRELYREKATGKEDTPVVAIDHIEDMSKMYFNTPERKDAYARYNAGYAGSLVSGIAGGKNFAYRYQDWSLDGGYHWSTDMYVDKPIPQYESTEGDIQLYIYKGERIELSDKEFCKINYDTEDLDECDKRIEKRSKLFERHSIYQLRKMGVIK
jgi:hypothetical protein